MFHLDGNLYRKSLTPIVCIASSGFPYSENPYHCIFLHELAKRLLRNNIKVFFVTTSFGKKDKVYSVLEGIPVFRMKLCKHSLLRKVITISKLFKYADVIHVHLVNLVGAMFVFLGKLLRKRTILTVHRFDILPTRNTFYSVLRLLALRLVDLAIAVSKATQKLAISAGAHPKKIVVIYNSIDESRFKPRLKEEVRKELGIESNGKIIIYVGALIPRKGVEYLIRAMQLVIEKIPNSILLVIGNGPEKEHLKFLSSQFGLKENIQFLGHIPTNLLALYYNVSDVFVLPSFHEGHAMVLLEAMASGLPIIATNVGGNVETITDRLNGYLVNPGDTLTIADRIIHILSDERLSRRFSNASLRLYKKRFSEATQNEMYQKHGLLINHL